MPMGNMDMGSGPLLRIYNEELAHGLWYIVAGFVVVMLFLRIFEKYEHHGRSAKSTSDWPKPFFYKRMNNAKRFISSN